MSWWPRPDYVDPEWVVETPAWLPERVLARAQASTHSATQGAWYVDETGPEFRTADLPCYRRALLTEARLQRSFDDGSLVASYLVVPMEAAEPLSDANHILVMLNGTAAAMLGAATAGALTLDGEAEVLSYMRLFCAQLSVEGGAFPLIADPLQVPWRASAPSDARARVEREIAAPELVGRESQGWRARATVLHAGSLVRAEFGVDEAGSVVVIDEEPALAEGLDVAEDRRLLGLRVLPRGSESAGSHDVPPGTTPDSGASARAA